MILIITNQFHKNASKKFSFKIRNVTVKFVKLGNWQIKFTQLFDFATLLHYTRNAKSKIISFNT